MGGCWSAYGLGGLVVESRYGAPGFAVWGVLRTGLREGSEAGARGGLEWPQNGVSSRAYGRVCPTEIESARNLTERLTPDLTSRLTGYLTVGLTESVSPEGRAGGQTGSGDRLELATAFPLGSLQDFRDDRMVDSQSLLDDGFPTLGFRQFEDPRDHTHGLADGLRLNNALG